VLIEHQFYDYSIRRRYISSLLSLNSNNGFGYAINATDITATCNDTIIDIADNALWLFPSLTEFF
jgi:hypothetical protein